MYAPHLAEEMIYIYLHNRCIAGTIWGALQHTSHSTRNATVVYIIDDAVTQWQPGEGLIQGR